MEVVLEPFPFEGRWAAHETVHLTEVHIVLVCVKPKTSSVCLPGG